MAMYYPYLRGKQYELLALRALCSELDAGQRGKVMPIIEPVRDVKNDAQTILAISAMTGCGMKFALILNPKNGAFEGSNAIFFPEDIKQKLSEGGDWTPAFIMTGDAVSLNAQIDTLISENGFSSILVILPKNEEASKWETLMNREEVTTLVVCDADSRSTMRQVHRYNKATVRLDDCFQTELRNKDYRGKEDQRFNDNVAFYEEDGFAGFGDYTILPEAYSKGGMLPWVVAIHMTYNRNEEEVWVHHFLSESNDNGTENIQRKFSEAAEQVKAFFEQQYPQDMTPAVGKLHQFVVDGHYPGLGSLKKVSIEHHITLMSRK